MGAARTACQGIWPDRAGVVVGGQLTGIVILDAIGILSADLLDQAEIIS